MNIKYVLKIEIEQNQPYLLRYKTFIIDFKPYQGAFPGQYIFNNKKDLMNILPEVKKRKLQYRIHYQLIPEKIEDFSSYKLTLPMIPNLKPDNKIFIKEGIVIEQSTLDILVSKRVKNIFDNYCTDIEWNNIDDGTSKLFDCSKASRNIIIDEPSIKFKNKIPKGTFTIIGNGIEIIDQTDQDTLQEKGILFYKKVEAERKSYPFTKTYIISIQVRAQLSNHGLLENFIFPMIGSSIIAEIEKLKI